MFVLRRITSEGCESNQILGENYHLVLKDRNRDEYSKTCQVMNWGDSVDDVFGFVVHNQGQDIIPLYLKSHYWIMASNGQTFTKIKH